MSRTTDICERSSKLGPTGTSHEGDRDKDRCHSTKLAWGPTEHIAHYSCDSDGKISHDLACLRSFSAPEVPTDLTKGLDEFYAKHRHNRTVGHPIPLDNLAAACVAFKQEDKLRNAHVVTWRGVLAK